MAEEVAATTVRSMSVSPVMSTAESQTALFSQTSTQSSTEGLKTFSNMGLDSGDEAMDFDETILFQNSTQLVSTDNN